METEKFNISLAKAGNPVVMKNGLPVRILCYDFKGRKPIVAACSTITGNGEYIQYYSEDGTADDLSQDFHLCMGPRLVSFSLEDAIKHCEAVMNSCKNTECRIAHGQLKSWLEELSYKRRECDELHELLKATQDKVDDILNYVI